MRNGLTVHVFDDPGALWEHMLERWRGQPGARLVLASRYARDRFFARHVGERTVWDAGVTYVSELTAGWRRELDLGRPLRAGETAGALARALAAGDFTHLAPLTQTADGLQKLAAHIEDIEARADEAYVPHTPVEHEVQRLRAALVAAGHAGEGRRHSELSRRAKNINAGGPLVFAPGPQPTPHFAGLAKGLSVHQPVTLYLLSTSSQLPALLRAANMTDVGVVEHFQPGFASLLFTTTRPATREDRHLWVHATNEVEAAAGLAWHWTAQGVPAGNIAVVCASPDALASEFAALAVRRKLPVHVRGRVRAHDTSLGMLLTAAATADLAVPAARAILVETADERFALTDADLPQAATLPALYELGVRLAERASTKDADIRRAHTWLEGLAADMAAYAESGLQPPVTEALAAAVSRRLEFGQPSGVAVVGYDEAPGLQFTHAVLLGLHEGAYPPPVERSPFLSDAAYADAPTLWPIDRRGEFASAVACASTVCFVSRNAEGDADGPFWTETMRAATPKNGNPPVAVRAPGESRQRVLQRMARSGVPHELLTRAQHQALRRRLPRGVLNGQRAQFSVTELEQFIACPYGWFVGHVLKPRRPPTPQAVRGTLLHNLLDNAQGQPPAERAAFVAAQLDTAVADGKLPAVEAATENHRLGRVLERYGGPDWPFADTRVEQRLRSDTLIAGSVVTGRADRVDVGPAGALVIDYKRSRTPRKRPASERQGELQRYLYPLLAAEQFGVEPLGGLYVSLRHGAHDGSLAHFVPELDSPFVDYDWAADAEVALELARNAIADIEQGNWETVGEGCPAWCPHRLLSETVG